MQPTFVSDAMPCDVWRLVEGMHDRGGAALAHLEEALASATNVMLEGDANYRRVVGDAPWPPEAPFAEACSYLCAPLLALRTMKERLGGGLAARARAAARR